MAAVHRQIDALAVNQRTAQTCSGAADHERVHADCGGSRGPVNAAVGCLCCAAHQLDDFSRVAGVHRHLLQVVARDGFSLCAAVFRHDRAIDLGRNNHALTCRLQRELNVDRLSVVGVQFDVGDFVHAKVLGRR